jgi:hypothetical protein
MSIWTMSEAQLENLQAGEIQRMPIGIFRCADAALGVEDKCDNVTLWEAPLEDWWEPKCPHCERAAVLVEPVEAE